MCYLADSIRLLNSSYSKEKILILFGDIMEKCGVSDYILTSTHIQCCTVPEILDGTSIRYSSGNYDIAFKYIEGKTVLTPKDIKCLLSALIVAIENASVYKGLSDAILLNSNSVFKSFNDLMIDVSNEVETHRRDGLDFCVAKVSLGSSKFMYKFIKYHGIISDIIRVTDSVYRDHDSLYILFRRTGIEGADAILNKLRDTLPGAEVGIAKWQNSYVFVDLISEVENNLYLSREELKEKETASKQELSKVLDKAILLSDTLIIVDSNEVRENHQPYIALEFNLGDDKFTVLKRCPNEEGFGFIYRYNLEDYVEDVVQHLLSR